MATETEGSPPVADASPDVDGTAAEKAAVTDAEEAAETCEPDAAAAAPPADDAADEAPPPPDDDVRPDDAEQEDDEPDNKPAAEVKAEKKKTSTARASKSPSRSPAKAKAASPRKSAPARSPAKSRGAATSDAPPPPSSPASSKKPLFDLPLQVEGKRQRQSVDRMAMQTSPARERTLQVPDGKGVKLGEIEFVEHMISKKQPENLKTLHRLCYGRSGASREIRKNLRQFHGFDFTSDSSPEYRQKKQTMEKWFMKDLKQVCEVLGLQQGAKKDEAIGRILDFLVRPTDLGKKGGAASGRKRKRATAAKGARGGKKAAAASESGSESGGDDDGDTSGEAEPENSHEEDEPAPKKPKRAPPVKSSPKVAAKSKTAAKEPKKPTDSSLKAAIKDLLKGVNLEEVTMKKMCTMVYDKFPNVDLTERKDFIKTTVKSMITAAN